MVPNTVDSDHEKSIILTFNNISTQHDIELPAKPTRIIPS